MPPSKDTSPPPSAVPVPGPFADLFAEAERQLTVCNSCRYCEGYCAVFPALERRSVLAQADLEHLANLCHDCRACLYACMYSPPHEFAINTPVLLSEVRARSWDDATRVGRARRTRRGRVLGRATVFSAFVVMAGLIVLLSGLTEGLSTLWRPEPGAASPYDVVSYPALLVAMGLPFLWAGGVFVHTVVRYWQRSRGPLRDLLHLGAWRGALAEAARMRYLRGGGEDCYYPVDDPSPVRRRLHGAVMYGFLLCLVSTVSAAILQDFLGSNPPYAPFSVPVVTGTLGGIGLVLGSAGLVVVKRRADPEAAGATMVPRDYDLLIALGLLGLTGLATLFLRDTGFFGPVLVVHLATVAVCFAVAPYSKFNHVAHRLLALVLDNLERIEERQSTSVDARA